MIYIKHQCKLICFCFIFQPQSSPSPDAQMIKRTSISPLQPFLSPTISPISSSSLLPDYSSASESIIEFIENHAENASIDFTSHCAVLSTTDAMSKICRIRDTDGSKMLFESPTKQKNVFSSTTVMQSNDFGYSTYNSKHFSSPVASSSQNMSWTPVQFSTPARKQHNDMSIDEN